MKETIIQFGEGNFLRGFVDQFLDILNKQGLYEGKAVVVQPTPNGRVNLLQDQSCKYNLYLRGIKNGQIVAEHTHVESISRCINPYADFNDYLALAENPDFRFIVSNTTEAGITFDKACQFEDKPCLSFPGKVTQLLYRRYQLGLPGFIFLPCELVDSNGEALKACVLRYIQLWGLEAAFAVWVEKENLFANTLVDRIVTGYPQAEADALIQEIGYDDKCLDTAECFGLWVIQGNFEGELPLQKAGIPIIWTEDVTPYKKRKVRVLNGAHTSTVFPAMLCGVETVGQAMKDELLSTFLKKNLFDHILPMLGENSDNLNFTSAVLDRFANPYIQHRWKAISLNSISKFRVRVMPTMLECKAQRGEWPKSLIFSLACLLKYYKEQEVSDEETLVAFIRTSSIEDILANETLWGTDLSDASELMSVCWERLNCDPVREVVQWAIS